MSPESEFPTFEPEDPEDEILRLWKMYSGAASTNNDLLTQHITHFNQLLSRHGEATYPDVQEKLRQLSVFIDYLKDNVTDLTIELEKLEPTYQHIVAERAKMYDSVVDGLTQSIESFEKNIQELEVLLQTLESSPNIGEASLENEIERLQTQIATHKTSIQRLKDIRLQLKAKQRQTPV